MNGLESKVMSIVHTNLGLSGRLIRLLRDERPKADPNW
ncbi:hypothetical protein SFOMI_3013 [Sphingobium fuliginis]|uniref:Uncharacterized protein n=1 Tax=Sphingobium fuliginis (strain ATCC 27551) TaxID=336203 RepID=A0A292ZHP4_SPHSA|nr:hypothetical protein SFOMI_3013 [Sphingobium fuliginis]